MIVITGAGGFIGSCLVQRLNEAGRTDLILVDDFYRPQKHTLTEGKNFATKLNRKDFFRWSEENPMKIDCFFHIGARTDTTEFNEAIFNELNFDYSRQVWNFCSDNQVPLIYASSAATYGDGAFGYEDDHAQIPKLQPLNPYGWSKQHFDLFVLSQKKTPPHWAGLKFFNVYGPNEFLKGRMASVVFHAFNQIKETGKVKLFRSHNPAYSDGCQLRDFIYVKDVCDVLIFLSEQKQTNQIFNLGTGKARTFLDLAHAVFGAMKLPPQIEFFDTPADIRDKYQYFTEAKMEKLRATGYINPFTTLEGGALDYVRNYLMASSKY